MTDKCLDGRGTHEQRTEPVVLAAELVEGGVDTRANANLAILAPRLFPVDLHTRAHGFSASGRITAGRRLTMSLIMSAISLIWATSYAATS